MRWRHLCDSFWYLVTRYICCGDPVFVFGMYTDYVCIGAIWKCQVENSPGRVYLERWSVDLTRPVQRLFEYRMCSSYCTPLLFSESTTSLTIIMLFRDGEGKYLYWFDLIWLTRYICSSCFKLSYIEVHQFSGLRDSAYTNLTVQQWNIYLKI